MAGDTSALRAGTLEIGSIRVARLGLGTNRLNPAVAETGLLQRALELDINFIDTAYLYGSGASEEAIGATLAPYAPDLLITTKGGYDDGSPQRLRQELEESLTRLRTDHVELYQLHRIDPAVPLEESVGAVADFQTEGKIRHIGLSEVTVEQLVQARELAEIVSVQNEYNVIERKHEALVDYCTSAEIAFIPWFPLGGLAGGAQKVDEKLAGLAAKYEASPQQIALAWLLRRSPMMLPIPGTISAEHLESNLRAAEITLSDEDLAELA
jgi:pyridoxine 4-dehydrogenase